MLQVRLGQPTVTAAAQPEGPYRLREGALDPGPPGVAAAPLLRCQPLARRPERLVLGPRRQLQVPGLVRGPGAQGPSRASGTISLAEHDRDVGCAGMVDLAAPGRGQLALGAAHPLALPVDLEAVEGMAALDLALPGRVRPRRAEQVDA